MNSTYMVSIKAAKYVISAAAPTVRPQHLCDAAGIDLRHLEDPTALISAKQLNDLYECAARMSKDTFLGLHVAARIDPRSFGALHYVIKHSPTLYECLNRAVRYWCLFNNCIAHRLETDGSSARFIREHKDASTPEARHDSEMGALASARFTRLMTGGHLKLREARFRHAPPKDASEHRKLFGAPVSFRMSANELIFDKRSLAASPVDSDPQLGDVLVQHMEHLLSNFSKKDSLIHRAESALREAICEGSVGLQAVAERLGMSTRSVQRALKNEGVSYRGILTNVRRDLAERYLNDPAKRISEVAYLLGYEHPSEFHRAFRSWTSMAPRTYRQSMMNASRSNWADTTA